MGVEARLLFYSTDEVTAERAATAAWERLDELDAILSDWRPDSELSRLSEAPVGTEVPVSGDLFSVLESAQLVADLSDGAFDVTAGPYSLLWREARAENRLPASSDLHAADEFVGQRLLRLLPDDPTGSPTPGEPRPGRVMLLKEGMRLDLGGVAKGYAAEQAVRALDAERCPRALVELGGDLAAGEPPPDRDAWETLAGCGPGRSARVRLRHQSLAVSGDTAQALVIDGVHHSHVVDPRTGSAVVGRTCVALVGRHGALTDAYASAVQVLGPHGGRRFLAEHPRSGLRLVHLERLDRPVAARVHDPLRLAPRLEPRLDAEGVWALEGELLVGRLPDDGTPGEALLDAGAHWELEFEAQGDGRTAVELLPRRAQPDRGSLTVNPPSGRWQHWEVHVSTIDSRVVAWRDGEVLLEEELPSAEDIPLDMAFRLVRSRSRRRAGSADDDEVKGGTVALREIKLRRLAALAPEGLESQATGALESTELGDLMGWTPLIEPGLPAWEVDRGGYTEAAVDFPVVDGVLHIPSSAGRGQLRTKQDFQDFRLRMDFKLAPGANSGLFLRGDRRGGDPAYSGCEIQIIDDHGWAALAGSELAPYQRCGSLYAAVPADAPGALRPTGEWNSYDVLYQGSRLAVTLNGQLLYDVDTFELDEASPPFSERVPTGFLGLQRYGAPHVEGDTALWVRNLFVQEL